jgi:hypothetical protein
MPAKPLWFSHLDSIIAELEALARPAVDRAALQRLLGVGARRAQQIMAPCSTETLGSSYLADRGRLIEHLRRLAAGDAAFYERRRRRRLAAILETERRRRLERPQVLVEAPASVVRSKLADLPDGVRLDPGRITVTFTTPVQALERLLALAMAIGNDREAFERRTALSGGHQS